MFFETLAEAAAQPLDPMELVYDGEVPVFEKYDEFLPAALVRKGFAHGILGIEEMKARIRGWSLSDGSRKENKNTPPRERGYTCDV